MDKHRLEKIISESYGITPDYPWMQYPEFAVFRHQNNRKWFALIMDVPKNKIGLPGEEKISVVNFKCDPLLICAMQGRPGVFPAYHMNKKYWVTVALDGSAPDDTVEILLNESYEITKPKPRKKPKPTSESES